MPKVALISLGCAKNLVDSELILGRLAATGGYEITNDPAKAEIVIVNTCGFIGQAKEEAIETLLRAAKWKIEGCCRILVGAGCLVQRYGPELAREMPEIDLWVTRARYGELPSLLELAAGEGGRLFSGPPELLEADWPRLRSTPPHRAYLRIADGCDNRCRYCVIPTIRGAYRSRLPAEILAEAERLAAEGVREITLIAQDTTAYGHDLPERPRLSDLLRRLVRIEGPRWWRLLYANPSRIDDELISLLAEEPRICRYLDIPIQHVSPHILRRMGRPDEAGAIGRLIGRLRHEIPGITLRTTLMVGFPGETEEDFRLLRDFVSATRFDWLGVFAYSREEGTPAARLRGQLPEQVKEERRAEILRLQQGISRELLAARVGRVFPVLVEGTHPERPGYLLARSEREAPEVDGVIHLHAASHRPGEFVQARVVKAGIYDLEAEPAEEGRTGRSFERGVEA